MPSKKKKYVTEVQLTLENMNVEPESDRVRKLVSTKYPQTVDGWVRKLGDMGFGLDEIAMLEAFVNSGMAIEALRAYEQKKDNIPFETAYKLYGYTAGSKSLAEKRWNRLSIKTQKRALEAIVKYNRYCQVTGVRKMHFATYIAPQKSGYNMEIPGPEKWTKWRNVLKAYAENIGLKKINPNYLASDDTIDQALEALMYRYSDAHITQVMGVLRWMRYTWGREFWHAITIQQACKVEKFGQRVIAAQQHIDIVRNAMQTKAEKSLAYDPDNVEQRIYQKLDAEAKAQETEEE